MVQFLDVSDSELMIKYQTIKRHVRKLKRGHGQWLNPNITRKTMVQNQSTNLARITLEIKRRGLKLPKSRLLEYLWLK
jgi:hypothetical protein